MKKPEETLYSKLYSYLRNISGFHRLDEKDGVQLVYFTKPITPGLASKVSTMADGNIKFFVIEEELPNNMTTPYSLKCKKCKTDTMASKVEACLNYIKKKGSRSSDDPVIAQCVCGHVMVSSDFEDLSSLPLSYKV